MKSKSKQCPNGHGALHRVFIKPSVDGKQKWISIPWEYCDKCGMMLPS